MTNLQEGMRAQLAEADSDAKRSSIDSAMDTIGSFAKLAAETRGLLLLRGHPRCNGH